MVGKSVRFAAEPELEQVYEYELPAASEENEENAHATTSARTNSGTKRTSEMAFLSSTHGRARRELREIAVFDLQSAVKHGVRTPGHKCPKTGLPRWIYTYGNVVYITDYTSTVEVTSYKQAISIERATITSEMQERHEHDRQILQNDPHICATHAIIIIDQSGSMRLSDVKGFKNRAQAAYGVLALEYIAEQLHQREEQDQGMLDAVSVIEMNDIGTLILDREPMDWILFNKLLDRQVQAKPRSHGNYFQALHTAKSLLDRELKMAEDIATDDLPSYQFVFLSDGKPSDKEPYYIAMQLSLLMELTEKLGENFSFHAIGLGDSGADFAALERLAKTVQTWGSTGTFTYSDLSCLKLGEAFSSVATSVTASRTEKLSIKSDKEPRKEKDVVLRSRSVPKSQRTFQRYFNGVTRWEYSHAKYQDRDDWPWTQINFKHSAAIGFDMERNPFGKGAERLAYMFYEIGRDNRRKGNAMVAKETKFVNYNEDRKVKFHETFCRTQQKANELALKFNKVVKRAPRLRPVDDSFRTPGIFFLDCCVYEYTASDGTSCGVLVEDFLKGKFTKYNSNNGYIRRATDERTLDLDVGEVYMSDFVQAFSHWVYVHSDHKMLVCDLQGVLNEEGRHPKFQLTDPCICTRDKKGRRLYGPTNLGFRGIRQFRMHHQCNGVCKGLGLQPFGRRHEA